MTQLNKMGIFSELSFRYALYRHLPDGSGGFVIEADHAVPAESLYLTFIDKLYSIAVYEGDGIVADS